MNFILAAIPFFFLLIAIELVTDKVRGTGYYRFNDAVSSLQLGILSRASGILKALIPLSIYVVCYEQFRMFTLDNSSYAVAITAFVLYDLGYYWVHRLSHRINVMWGSHVVHHSSEEYNLTTALRQTSTPALFAGFVYLPLAFLGVSPALLIACASLNLIYQFWVHTRHIDKLPGWFEAIFVTPSHHRVHHGLNRDYIDKNFAGVFILWDKIFGSFQEEKRDVTTVYGVSQQLKSWNPIWANFQVYTNLWQDMMHTKSWSNKLKVWLMPPGWRPEDAAAANPRGYATTKTLVKYDIKLNKKEKCYVLLQHVSTIGFTFWLLLNLSTLSLATGVSLAIFVIYSLYTIACLQEKQRFAFWLEAIRLTCTASIVIWLAPLESSQPAMIFALFYTVISMLFLSYNHRYSLFNEQHGGQHQV
ncbi:MAG: sterol desaturase family protein [Thalassotalea sp.]|nr:sterol desaturase family protein [Thalassotalea sp.]